MKKLLAIAAVAAVALTSCVKNEVITPAGGEITFKDFTLSNKALILPDATVETALPETETFGAFALYTGTYESIDTDAAPNQIYVTNGKVAYDGKWAYTTPTYWPTNTGDALDFYAYYPYNETVASWDAENNCVKLTSAQLTSTLGDQIDWMVAAAATGKNSTNAASGVGIAFSHITSMLVFNAQDVTTDTRYQNLVTIKKIEVKQAAYTGNYTNATWSAWADRADVAVMNHDHAVGTTLSNVTTAASGALIVVPETLADAVEFVVTYDIAESADHVYEAATGKTVTIKANTLTAILDAGKKYVYTINFDLVNGINEKLEEITFVPTVLPWEEVVGGTYDNI